MTQIYQNEKKNGLWIVFIVQEGFNIQKKNIRILDERKPSKKVLNKLTQLKLKENKKSKPKNWDLSTSCSLPLRLNPMKFRL